MVEVGMETRNDRIEQAKNAQRHHGDSCTYPAEVRSCRPRYRIRHSRRNRGNGRRLGRSFGRYLSIGRLACRGSAVSTAEISAVEHYPDADQHHCDG